MCAWLSFFLTSVLAELGDGGALLADEDADELGVDDHLQKTGKTYCD